jgi:putative tryptophan/tyrosine transport system substrate-binding protein
LDYIDSLSLSLYTRPHALSEFLFSGPHGEMTMTRITVGLVVLLAVGLVGRALAATAPPRVPVIGMLLSFPPPTEPDWKQHSVFLQELRTLGWREGENLTIEYRWASGRLQRGADLAAELVSRHVDVIVVDNRVLGQAVHHVTTTIPIVMLSADDPVAEGLVTSLGHPGGNITGIDNSVTPELGGKLLALLTEAVPAVKQIAVLVDPRYVGTRSMFAETTRVAQALGVQLHVLEVHEPAALPHALATATAAGDGALLVLPALLFAMHQPRLVALAAEHRLPAIAWYASFAHAGGLLAYGPNLAELSRRMAYYVDRLLKGAKPADLPIERPTRFELVINLKTAQVLGLTIPPRLLFQADEVIR